MLGAKADGNICLHSGKRFREEAHPYYLIPHRWERAFGSLITVKL